jgi:metal-responsive CopG/Arc/MetJ family transcriptional regulator
MSTSPNQQQINVSIDAELLEQVDQWTSDRTEAIAEGLRLWCNRAIRWLETNTRKGLED